MRTLVNEFKAFILRGNVLDLAVAVVIGAAFTSVVNTFANDVLLQIIAAVFGQADFSDLVLTLRDTPIRYGAFLTALVNFLIVAFGVFVVVKAVTALQDLRREQEREGAADGQGKTPAPTDEVLLLREIRDLLARDGG